VYRVKNWEEHFENNRTSDMVSMKWVPFPNKHDGDGFTELLDHPQGMAHFGAWVLIVQVASKCGKPAGRCGSGETPRGTLRRENGKAHDAHSIARVTGGDLKVIQAAIPRLLDIGWLEVIPDDISTCENPQEGAGNPQAPAPIPQGGDDGKEGKGKELEDPPISPKGGHFPDLPALVIAYLNEKTGKRFRSETAANRKPILARAASGFVLEDFQKVIDNKVADWLDDPKMNEYLCPETLFRPGKFEKYLNQSSAGASDGAHSKPSARGYETAQQRKDRRLREVMARYGSPRGSNPDAHHPALHLGEEGTPGGRSAGHGDEVGNG
jgi:uncharacterized phage protein (TIGR02220 family)